MKHILSTVLLACCAVPMMAQWQMQPMVVVMPNGSIPAQNLMDEVPLFEQDLMTSRC